MMIHRSLRVEEDMWRRMEEKARQRGFTATNAYLRYIIQENLSGGVLEETEERLVTTIGKLSSQIKGIGTMHQASFAAVWQILEVLVSAFPDNRTSHTSEQRLKELRVRIAGDVRGNSFKEFANGAGE